jgi:hypothetical protein
MQIRPVNAREGLAEFIEFPWTIYANDPSWIPPLREQVFFELSGASAFSQYGRSQLFLCEADGRPAGRIAALINPRLVDQHGNVFGQLGYFECIDDSVIASNLIRAGMDWLRTQGVPAVLAPMNGGAHRQHRLMTRGFDLAPFLFEPRNPAYYPELLSANGFVPVHQWFSYEFDSKRAGSLLNQFDRVLSRRPPPGEIQNIAPDRLQEIISRIQPLLNGCWAGHVGYATLDPEEFVEVIRGGLSIMQPGNISTFVQNGQDKGFALTYPDYASDVRALKGSAGDWGKWLGRSRPKRIVLHTAALLPEVRSSSAAMAQMAWALRKAIDGGFEDIIVALAVEGFLSRIGEQTRDYTLYARSI